MRHYWYHFVPTNIETRVPLHEEREIHRRNETVVAGGEQWVVIVGPTGNLEHLHAPTIRRFDTVNSAAHCTQSFPRLLFHGSNLAFSSQSNLGDRPDQCYVSWPVVFFETW